MVAVDNVCLTDEDEQVEELDLWALLFRKAPENAHAMLAALIKDRETYAKYSVLKTVEHATFNVRKELESEK